jgi:CHAD domain-containing protein
MAKKVDPSISIFGAGVLLKHLHALRQEIAGVRAAQDIEYVHRMRVASRRLRSALDLFASALPASKQARWVQQVRGVTRALGAARDTDVQIDRLRKFYAGLDDPRCRPGIRRLVLRLSQRREKMQGKVIQALDELEASGIFDEMEKRLQPLLTTQGQVYLYTPALFQLAFQQISEKLDGLISYEMFIDNPERVNELHEMRIAAKHLRYALEAFAPLYGEQVKAQIAAIRKVQEALGDIHDCDVWTTFLPQFIEDERRRTRAYFGNERIMLRLLPGLQSFLQDRSAQRQKLYLKFLEDWHAMQADGLWERLRQVIQTPFNLGEAFDQLAAAPAGEPDDGSDPD